MLHERPFIFYKSRSHELASKQVGKTNKKWCEIRISSALVVWIEDNLNFPNGKNQFRKAEFKVESDF